MNFLDSDCQRLGGECSMKEENCTGSIDVEVLCENSDQLCCVPPTMPPQEPGMYDCYHCHHCCLWEELLRSVLKIENSNSVDKVTYAHPSMDVKYQLN